ncbi:Endonuclease/Exonuclease/phosphatase family [Seminavis robusta]|uniref:Endonuclease/Exonuclease/phosphatase family n=1 Tax=Seminavis robusta TaxID=568900 RepID=A0A9N8F5C7_9STRA|nr:Endonuclease/Exonuclease/phosphatase family [Seminavis robusta]|eukprot:Sro3324_g346810.1 Endonuclease/Exonuclease/phosphatase family (456) ;mRNA; r:3161-4528
MELPFLFLWMAITLLLLLQESTALSSATYAHGAAATAATVPGQRRLVENGYDYDSDTAIRYHHNHHHDSPQLLFQLLSWNVLAPVYAPPWRHPWSLPEHLDWTFRKQRIVDTLFAACAPPSLLPDIICLQEVQVDLWESDLKPALQARAAQQRTGRQRQSTGYHSSSYRYLEQLQGNNSINSDDEDDDPYWYLLQKVKKKPIANAILVRKEFATCLAVESRSRAVIAVLELNNNRDNDNDNVNNPQRFIVANVHLQAGMGAHHQMQRFYQINSLMKRIRKFVRQYSPKGESSSLPVIIVGDFNMSPDTPLYHLLQNGYLPPEQYNDSAARVSTSSRDQLTPENLQELAESSLISHLPLQDAYRDCEPPQGKQASTYTSGDVIDYLWTTVTTTTDESAHGSDEIPQTRLAIHETWQAHPDGSLDAAGMFCKGRRYPNDENPSDHLPIGAMIEMVSL